MPTAPKLLSLNPRSKRDRQRDHDKRRGSAASRGYGARWRKARKIYLAEHPLCVFCEREDRTTAANTVDHIIPHRGDEVLFWDQDNWQSLCKTHHDGTKQSMEKSGRVKGSDGDGIPVDSGHHWNR